MGGLPDLQPGMDGLSLARSYRRPENSAMARTLGLDVGTKTIGVAVADEGGTVAFPVTTVKRVGMRRDIAALLEIAEDRGADEAVVGLPLNLDGSPGEMAPEARAVAERLESEGLSVHLYDERMSTVSAERALLEGDVSRKKRKTVIDKVAATLILQAWLDARIARRARDAESSE